MGLPDIDNIPDSGAVFTIGRSRFADNFASHFFIRQDPVVSIVCGDEHSAVVCQSGRLFVFGSNDWGQLGLGHKNHVSKPSCVKILKPEKITNVACGRAHTLICTGGQKIFACGSDQEGQLGRGGLAAGDSSSSPVLVYDCGLAGPRILQIAAGSHHSMALISDGGVIAWGSNLEGQLGLPGTTGLVNKPTKVPIPEPVRAISTGYYHSAFLTESGLIYVCGEAESGKLGIVVNFSTQAAPKQLQLPGPAAKIACGGHHSLVLTETGALYCFGSNVSGQLGMGVSVTEVQTPKLLPRGDTSGEVITQIAAGESHTAIVTESGKLFMCGDGRHGKLGLEENENNVHEITHAVKYEELIVTDVSCGGCHTILVGKRREDTDEDSAAVHSDSVSRKNSLPPLKIPGLGKLGDLLPEKNVIDSAMKSVENGLAETRDNVKDAVMSAKEELQNNVEGMVKNVTDTVKQDVEVVKKTAGDIMGSMKEAIGHVEKPEFPKKLADYMEEGKKTEELLDELANETEETGGDKIHGDSDGGAVDNAKEMNRKQSASSLNSTISAHSNRSIDSKRKSSLNSLSKIQKPESPNYEHPIPPPKPPRQKSGLSNSVIDGERILSASKSAGSNDSAKSAEKTGREGSDNSTNPFEIEDGIGQAESDIAKKPTTRKSLESLSLKNEGHEIDKVKQEETEINKAKETEDVKGQEKAEMEMTQDDSDVVQSPAPRTGKISKLFKGKKPQADQNGVKGNSSASNSKVKSRTCTVL
ncbi:X-linked retinitis pigmentosa GTPase regulator-like [Athalia rosae]|uniref:X-linked retinitis pigmentosa GTPase regulator-like n=1 Tax=Athalia rosae TaxID=37344 RepID=UPI002033CAB3|nr:X-linked retinitis pigmentosa GTPase regulator-like [Athalia rosae]XP_048510357.1 X-linked retinitis pigmentosa GTPase regulator-like [Athalia rosae]